MVPCFSRIGSTVFRPVLQVTVIFLLHSHLTGGVGKHLCSFFFLVLFGLNGRTLLLNPLSLSAGYVSLVCRSTVHYYILFKIKNENKLFPLFSFPTLCIKRTSVLCSFSKNRLLVLKLGKEMIKLIN